MKKNVITGVLWAVAIFSWFPLISTASSWFFVDSGGNVGIGISDPQAKLDVAGAMYSRATTTTSSVNWSSGNVQTMTLTSSPTLTFSNGQAGGEYRLILTQDGTGGRTITWPGSVKWPSGSTPTLTSTANGIDAVTFVYDGTNYLGSFSRNFTGLNVLLDYFGEGTRDAEQHVTSGGSGYIMYGQGFTMPAGDNYNLTKVKFYMTDNENGGTLTGNFHARLYASTGTMGTNATPTGSPLATSDSVAANTLDSYPTFTLEELTFTGAQQYELQAGTNYFIVIYYDGATDGILLGSDASSPAHSGNTARYISSWASDSTRDISFYVYGR